MRKNKRSLKKVFNKNKYNIVLFLIFAFIALLMIGKFSSYLANRDLAKYDEEILVIKNNDSEIKSLSLKDLRKIDSTKVDIKQNNDLEISAEGISLEKLLNKVNIDPNKNKLVEFVDGNGNKSTMALEQALEVDRVFIIYRLVGKPNIEYDDSLGVMFVVDSQNNDSSKWIKDVKIINVK